MGIRFLKERRTEKNFEMKKKFNFKEFFGSIEDIALIIFFIGTAFASIIAMVHALAIIHQHQRTLAVFIMLYAVSFTYLMVKNALKNEN